MKRTSTALNLMSVVLLLAVVLGLLFFVNPMRAEIGLMEVNLAEKELQVSELSAKVAELEAIKEEVGSSGISEDKLLTQVPEGISQDELIVDLSELSTTAGIELHGMSFSTVESEDGAGAVSISASFDGDYEDLIGFLQAVEDSSRKIKVKSINVQLSSEDDVAKASFSLLMEAYYQ
ncbi:MAG: Tfp pilus assembly protein PilO [Candidatus Peregrinibacteria bacterium GW2011_GWF2_43_17]|nr:MAG: Tfp pilus assembly protein PilO [Candidatus Peregrinibacteria bacterium GW2011_GWF2_43_17]KKT20502.1 MAG: Tfp pilus assembly protein PilO [Candidatus Peregrinibacteria bacterium GW2011_GWA2_43_8]HAU40293.1 hypothetical protein [Candidatus Peregrinibacteria bacterium]